MRINPTTSLSVQLLQEARFGPERFAPFGPPLESETSPLRLRDMASFESLAPPSQLADTVLPPVGQADTTQPVLGYSSQGMPKHISGCINPLAVDPPPVFEVTTLQQTTVLPSHLVGSLLDVLA